MKTIMATLCTLFLFISFNAMAEWTEVGSDNIGGDYVDLASIRKKGNLVKIWVLTDYNTTQHIERRAFLSGTSQLEYDCKKKQSRTLAITTFSGNIGKGQVVDSIDANKVWHPVQPESIGETGWKIACGLRL